MPNVPEDIAQLHAAMAECAMISGNREKAVAAIDSAFSEAAREASGLSLDAGLEKVTSPRTVGILNARLIFTVGHLVANSEAELLSIPQVGESMISQLRSAIHELGYKFRKP